jgi:hypothetical protein
LTRNLKRGASHAPLFFARQGLDNLKGTLNKEARPSANRVVPSPHLLMAACAFRRVGRIGVLDVFTGAARNSVAVRALRSDKMPRFLKTPVRGVYIGALMAEAAVAPHSPSYKVPALDMAVDAVPVIGRAPKPRVGEGFVRPVTGDALRLIVAGRATLPVQLCPVAMASQPPCGSMAFRRFPLVAALAVVAVPGRVAQRAVRVYLRLREPLAVRRNP